MTSFCVLKFEIFLKKMTWPFWLIFEIFLTIALFLPCTYLLKFVAVYHRNIGPLCSMVDLLTPPMNMWNWCRHPSKMLKEESRKEFHKSSTNNTRASLSVWCELWNHTWVPLYYGQDENQDRETDCNFHVDSLFLETILHVQTNYRTPLCTATFQVLSFQCLQSKNNNSSNNNKLTFRFFKWPFQSTFHFQKGVIMSHLTSIFEIKMGQDLWALFPGPFSCIWLIFSTFVALSKWLWKTGWWIWVLHW